MIETFKLFPTVVKKYKVPLNIYGNVDWLKDESLVGTDETSSMFGKHSINKNILDSPNLSNLKKFILRQATSFSYELGYLEDSFKISLSWISKKDPGEAHTRHVHPNSFLSGVFYFGDYNNQPGITFHSPKPPRAIEPSINPVNEDFPLSWEYYSIQVEAGDMVLFLSDINHSVPVNNSNKSRFSLAFNIMPTSSLGDYNYLTFFKY